MLPKTLIRVLLVDDSMTVLAIHQAILEESGFECHTAESGAEALEILMRETFQLVVTDLNMPKMDGYELVKKMRAAQLQVPVVMVTTEQEEADRARGLQAGVDVYLTKPVDPEDFVTQCRMLAS